MTPFFKLPGGRNWTAKFRACCRLVSISIRRPGFRRFSQAAWVILTALLLQSKAFAQARYQPRYQEPQWFTFRLSEVSAGAYAEGTFDQTSYQNSSTSVNHEHLFVGPTLGIVGSGSIYHPNLITYNINSEGAFGWARDDVDGSSSRNEFHYLGRFSGNVDFLENKPYRGGLFANYDHTYRDNDFFNRVTVDSWR